LRLAQAGCGLAAADKNLSERLTAGDS